MDERAGEIRDTLTSKGTSSSLDFYFILRSLFRINKECLILETLCPAPQILHSCRWYFLRSLDCTRLLYYLLSYPALGLQLTKSTLLFPEGCVVTLRWVFSVNFVELTLEVRYHINNQNIPPPLHWLLSVILAVAVLCAGTSYKNY